MITTQLFTDSFDRPATTAGNIGNGWLDLKPNMTAGSDWSVSASTDLSAVNTTSGTSSAVLNTHTVQDCEVVFQANRTNYNSTRRPFIETRIQSNGDRYRIRLSLGNDNTQVDVQATKVVKGVTTELWKALTNVTSSTSDFKYIVRCYSFNTALTVFEVYYINTANNNLVLLTEFSDADPALASAGKVGLGHYNQVICKVFTLNKLALDTPQNQTIYYVATTGNDTSGKGTKAAPWATVEKALTTVMPDSGHVINVAAGTYTLATNPTLVPSGITLIGDGKPTIIGALKLSKGRKNRIINFNFTGTSTANTPCDYYKHNTGIEVRDTFDILLHNLSFKKYRKNALRLLSVHTVKVSSIDMVDSSYSDRYFYSPGSSVLPQNADDGLTSQTQSNCLEITRLTKARFVNVHVDTTSKRGGAGLRTYEDLSKFYNSGATPSTYLDDIDIQNCTFLVDKFMSWGGGYSPQMSLEIFNHKTTNTTIRNCVFNSTVSLASGTNTPALKLYECEWIKWLDDQPLYAIEVVSTNLEIFHNYITAGSYPIYNSGAIVSNILVHSNVFRNVGYVVNFKSLSPLKFYNNTVYIGGKDKFFNFGSTGQFENPNNDIANNIFYYDSATAGGDKLGATIGVRNNLFHNMDVPTTATNSKTGKPLWVSSGQPVLSTDYRPQQSSPVRGSAAVISGVTPEGESTPDIGAHQWELNNKDVWHPGIKSDIDLTDITSILAECYA
jgi:hypothetical protein